MFVVVLVAMEAHAGVQHDATYLSLTYGGLVASVAVMYTRARARPSPTGADDARRRARAAWVGVGPVPRRRGRPVAASAPRSGSSGFVASLVSTLAGTLTATGRRHRHRRAPLVERMGAFTIIVCGEAFVKVAIAVSGSSVLEVDVVALFFQFVLTFAIWTSYFEDVPQAGIRAGWLRPWLGLHLVLQLAIAGTAIGVAKLVKVDPLDHLPSERHPRDHRDARHGLPGARARSARAPGDVPLASLFVLRLVTAAVVVIVGSRRVADRLRRTSSKASPRSSVVAVLYAVRRRTGITREPPGSWRPAAAEPRCRRSGSERVGGVGRSGASSALGRPPASSVGELGFGRLDLADDAGDLGLGVLRRCCRSSAP